MVATRRIVTLHDDLDGTDAEETVVFSIDGIKYEIDLNGSHNKELRDALRPFIAAARTVKPGRRARPRLTKNSKTP